MSDTEDNTVEVVNISSDTVKFELDGVRMTMKPRDKRHIHKAYALPKQLQKDRDPVASTIELITGKKVLAVTDPRAMAALGIRQPRPTEETT